MPPVDAATISLLLHGAGRMGDAIRSVVKETDGVSIRGTLDLREAMETSRPEDTGGAYFRQLPERILAHEVVVDFSRAGAIGPLITSLRGSTLRLVSGTTGLDEAERQALRDYAREAAVFYDANMSYGISLLKLLLEQVAMRRGDLEDVEIVEYHHRGKVDRPSGTALALAKVLSSARPRHDEGMGNAPEDRPDIPIQSIRIGGVPGEHHVHFASPEEVLTLSHRALTRTVFARGAIGAARFLCSKDRGLYAMKDMILEQGA